MFYAKTGNKDGIEYFCYGYGPVKALLKTVYFFKIGNLLIDTGSRNTRQLIPAFSDTEKPTDILVTHFHEDHTGNLAHFVRTYGATAYGHSHTAEIMQRGFSILPYEKIMFGHAEPAKIEPLPEKLAFGSHSFIALHTPGHSPDHTAYFEPQKGWLFCGDLYVAERIKIWRKGENMKQQIASLEKLCSLDFDVLACNHNPQWKNGKSFLLAKLEYFRQFYGQAAHCHAEGFSVSETMKKLSLKENHLIRLFTYNDVAARHMVQSVFDSESGKDD